jgi:hypothetical protein
LVSTILNAAGHNCSEATVYGRAIPISTGIVLEYASGVSDQVPTMYAEGRRLHPTSLVSPTKRGLQTFNCLTHKSVLVREPNEFTSLVTVCASTVELTEYL